MRTEWQAEPPAQDGWWLFYEFGTGTQVVLIRDGWVCSDDEWQQETGVPAEVDGWVRNYWEGNDANEMTDGTLTAGVWVKIDAMPGDDARLPVPGEEVLNKLGVTELNGALACYCNWPSFRRAAK